MRSHPMWVRELKLKYLGYGLINAKSHPMWVRELKLGIQLWLLTYPASHPMWVRELKRTLGKNKETSDRRTLCGCVN